MKTDSRDAPSSEQACVNADREIWREREGDYYADSIHVTERGGIGINCGGHVYVKPVREWHKLAGGIEAMRAVEPPLETGAPSRDWVEFRQQADRGEHPLPPAAPAATPRTDAMDEEPDIVHRSAGLAVLARQLERENAELRAQLVEVKEALAGDDYASLPSDYPLARMAHTIRADHDKFRNQVIDTCKRAETAERQRVEVQKDAERYRWVLPILNGDGHEGDERAFAIAAQLLKGLNGDAAIDAAKEASNG